MEFKSTAEKYTPTAAGPCDFDHPKPFFGKNDS